MHGRLISEDARCNAWQDRQNSLVGMVSAISLCLCSGLAGVFFELMLKVRAKSVLLYLCHFSLATSLTYARWYNQGVH